MIHRFWARKNDDEDVTVYGSVLKIAHCEACDTDFEYALALSRTESPPDSCQTAKEQPDDLKRARCKLERTLNSTFGISPCPRCDQLPSVMTDWRENQWRSKLAAWAHSASFLAITLFVLGAAYPWLRPVLLFLRPERKLRAFEENGGQIMCVIGSIVMLLLAGLLFLASRKRSITRSFGNKFLTNWLIEDQLGFTVPHADGDAPKRTQRRAAWACRRDLIAARRMYSILDHAWHAFLGVIGFVCFGALPFVAHRSVPVWLGAALFTGAAVSLAFAIRVVRKARHDWTLPAEAFSDRIHTLSLSNGDPRESSFADLILSRNEVR